MIPVFQLSGPPGVGKSSVGRCLAEAGGVFFSGGDVIRSKFATGERPVFEMMNDVMKALKEKLGSWKRSGKSFLVLDTRSPNPLGKYYEDSLLAKFGFENRVVIELEAAHAVLLERMRGRGREKDEDKVLKRLEEYDAPFVKQGRAEFQNMHPSNVVCINAEGTLADVVQACREIVNNYVQHPPYKLVHTSMHTVCSFVDDFEEYHAVLSQLHRAFGISSATQVGGYLLNDNGHLSNPTARRGEPLMPTDDTYTVSKKLDGTRYLMVLHNRVFYLVPTHTNGCYKLNVDKRFEYNNSPPRSTLVCDCELVLHRDSTWVLYVLDIMADMAPPKKRLIGRSDGMPLLERMKHAGKYFPLEGSVKATPYSADVVCKNYYPLKKVVALLTDFHKQSDLYPTDGLILTPKRHYITRTDGGLIKWKPKQHLTVDLLLRREGSEARLFSLTSNPFGYKHFGDIYLSTAELEEYNGRILECCKKGADWTVVRVRHDKMYPNSDEIAQKLVSPEYDIPASLLVQLLPEILDKTGSPMELTGPCIEGVVCSMCKSDIEKGTYILTSESANMCRVCVESSCQERIFKGEEAHADPLAEGRGQYKKNCEKESDRTTSQDAFRAFNNWIKLVLIMLCKGRGHAVLDLGCGKGGDLCKYQYEGHPSVLVCIDRCEESIRAAVQRYITLRLPIRTQLCVSSITSKSLLENIDKCKLYTRGIVFDMVSCQFALHYAWGSDNAAETLIRNASGKLATDGMFICTTVDFDAVKAGLQAHRGTAATLHFGKGVLNVCKEVVDRVLSGDEGTGLEYTFTLPGFVDGYEYLVSPSSLVGTCKSHGLELVPEYSLNFMDFRDMIMSKHSHIGEEARTKQRVSFTAAEDKQHFELSSLYKVYVFKNTCERASDWEPPEAYHDLRDVMRQ
eukprot:TRINITY_DN11865_c0_g1_i1.p1 TRINITY_DN11865_c0_g1~~TRINITY_DN11865_c0_g1_i1.p1  ORF type:complete len:925 (+),score=166.07 TRINITY_DN11865_c0_g1_i1:59-2776(+)